MRNEKILDAVCEYISNNGCGAGERIVKSLFLSLKTRPFAILGGIPGAGKSMLARLFAEGFGAEKLILPVNPDWCNPGDVFGEADITGSFVSGEAADFIKRASENPEKPYILILDEINLARPEFYLCGILSVMENRRFADGRIVTDRLFNRRLLGNDSAAEDFAELIFPDNLYIIGTLNSDSTNFPLSRRLYDRINLIELPGCDMAEPLCIKPERVKPVSIDNEFLRSEFLSLGDCSGNEKTVKRAAIFLDRISALLARYDCGFGYRIRNEIIFYLLYAVSYSVFDETEAMDFAILQRILPNLIASSHKKAPLISLFGAICGLSENEQTDCLSAKAMNEFVGEDCRYPISAKRLALAVEQIEEEGFGSLHF